MESEPAAVRSLALALLTDRLPSSLRRKMLPACTTGVTLAAEATVAEATVRVPVALTLTWVALFLAVVARSSVNPG